MIAVQIIETATKRVFALDADDYRSEFVDMRDDADRIDEDDSIFHALDNRLGLTLFVHQALDIDLVEPFQPIRELAEFVGDRLQLGQRLLAKLYVGTARAATLEPLGHLHERPRNPPAKGPRQGDAENQ